MVTVSFDDQRVPGEQVTGAARQSRQPFPGQLWRSRFAQKLAVESEQRVRSDQDRRHGRAGRSARIASDFASASAWTNPATSACAHSR